ncbi:MAG: hypothetical protein K2K22_04125, partial [Muribaculaceae bacterium]|nr:hypothetical protein [Muribaculaceae bacterium]
MKKVYKLFVGLVGLAATASMAYAAVSAAAPEFNAPMRAADEATEVSAYWSLGLNEDYNGASASTTVGADAIASTNLEISNLTKNRKRTCSEVDFTTYNPVEAYSDESAALTFTLTPAEGISFKPTSIEFKSVRCGTDAGAVSAKLIRGTEEILLVDKVTPNRNGNSTSKPNPEGEPQWTRFSVSEPLATLAGSNEPVVLKIFVTGTNREYGFAHVGIYGTTVSEGGDTPVIPEIPAGYAEIPGAIAVVDGSYSSANMLENAETATPNVGRVMQGSWAEYKVYATEEGGYAVNNIAFYWANGNEADIVFTVTDEQTQKLEAKTTYHFDGVGQSAPVEIPLDGRVTVGTKILRMEIGNVIVKEGNNGYVTNWKDFTVAYNGSDAEPLPDIPEGWDVAPGTIHVAKGTYEGSLHIEDAGNVGYTRVGDKATYQFYAMESGVYRVDIDFTWYNNTSADFVMTVRDIETGETEASATYPVTSRHSAHVLLDGCISAGRKELVFDVTGAPSDNYIANWVDFGLVKVGEKLAKVAAVTAEGLEATEIEGYDWSYNIPLAYDAATVSFKVVSENASLTVKEGENVLEGVDGVYTIAVPAGNEQTEVTLSLSVEDGVYAAQTEYKVRFFRHGDVTVKTVTVDGVEMPLADALNAEGTATVADRIYTATPVVEAVFTDGSKTTATVSLDGQTATYSFTGVLGDLSKNFTLVVEGLHLYEAADTDKDVKVVYDSANLVAGENCWSNGQFTISPVSDGWGGTQFKFNTRNGNTIHIDVPSYMLVKKLVLARLKDNYTPGKITSVTSEGATVWMPTASDFVNGDGVEYDLVCVVEDHSAGTGFDVTFEGGSQPVWWWELTYEEVTPTDLVATAVNATVVGNDAVVRFSFDREVGNVMGTVNGSEVVDGYSHGTSFLYFPLWELDYGTEYTVTVPQGYLRDVNGVSNSQPLTCTFTTGSPAETVEPMADERFIVVSNADELRDAVAGLSATNSNADSDLTVIYLLNGDYDLGADTNGTSTTQALHLNRLYNVALIGESEEGVLIHGTRFGISYAVLSTRYSTNIYMQNLTIRNDADFGGAHTAGVAVAHYGGNLDIMRNVTLQSHQDTQVTGERGYYYNCTFYGKTDYICGGGDHFYDSCHFVMTEEGGVIAAPSTSSSNIHGHVFSNCDISGAGSYDLGRPWQNEPRAFWLNTTMYTLSTEAGWRAMSNLTTHFFEYGTVDGGGSLIDLSTRRTPSSSVNSYSPVLDAQYVSYFTSRNVLGYKDAFDAEDYKAAAAVPVNVNTYLDGNLCWDEVPGAIRYIVLHNGAYLCSVSGAFVAAEQLEEAIAAKNPAQRVSAREAVRDHEFRVVALNALGQASEASATNNYIATGVDAVAVADDADAVYYNLQGVRVA